jgi:hypothetical protein
MQAADLIQVEMTAGEWNQAMAVLAEGPYRVVAPLLAKIREQALAQDGHPGTGGAALLDPAGESEERRVSD